MRMYDIIKKKRDGYALTDAEIQFFINGYVKGEIADYQASALLMAIYFNGMSEAETNTLTECMMRSGDTVDLSEFGALTVDKHSTGGVGDKTSLIVMPIMAAAGCVCAKMSGRGLGHTGGTVDKLEAFSGYKTELSPDGFLDQVKKVGIALIGQSGNLTPADKKLYALRDVTATVDSIPLIASSIMSKKLASGAHNIVLDVKYGSGAFMKTAEDAKKLGKAMVKIGKGLGRNVSAVITDMNSPLGANIGNSLELKEAIDVLNGKGPDDLKTVALTLSAKLLSLSKGKDFDTCYKIVTDILVSGKALLKMREWIVAQGGDDAEVLNPELLGNAPCSFDVKADRDGYIVNTDAEKIGICACNLGAGRVTKESEIDLLAGIVMRKKTGDSVQKGDIIATLYSSNEDMSKIAADYQNAVTIKNKKPQKQKLIYDII